MILELSHAVHLVHGEAILFDCLVRVLETADEEALLCKINRFLASILQYMDEMSFIIH